MPKFADANFTRHQSSARYSFSFLFSLNARANSRTHVGLHLLDRPIERIGHLPRRHDRQIDSQQYPDHHEQLIILYHLCDHVREESLRLSVIKCDDARAYTVDVSR